MVANWRLITDRSLSLTPVAARHDSSRFIPALDSRTLTGA
jgi:hypothetical protein